MKKRTLYIFEGASTIFIRKGEPLIPEDSAGKHTIKMVNKGIFGGKIEANHIPDTYLGTPKKLDTGKIVQGWEVIRVKIDLRTHETYAPDVPPVLLVKLSNALNEVEIWKRKYFEARNINLDREQKDRFRERVKEEFKFVGESRQQVFSGFGQGGIGGFGGGLYGPGFGGDMD